MHDDISEKHVNEEVTMATFFNYHENHPSLHECVTMLIVKVWCQQSVARKMQQGSKCMSS